MQTDNPIMETADVFYKDSPSEELQQPTDEADVTKAEAQPPQQEVEDKGEPAEVENTEAEESEAEDTEEAALYVEIDGEEHNLDDVKKWRDGHLMQSDYTKKTQAVAKEREELEAERETLLSEKAELSGMRDQLAVLVAEDAEFDWAELKEDDPEEYIRLKERADKRKEALEKVQAERNTPADDPATIAQEQKKLFAANTDWFDDEGKPTEVYSKDIALMNDYVGKAGFAPEEFARMTRAHHLTTILKAAKYDELQAKGREIKSKREKVQVVTKPKSAKTPSAPKPTHEVFYGQ